MKNNIYKLSHKDKNSNARLGILSLTHTKVETPVFMPVGTLGTVKGVPLKELTKIGFKIILGNTYHLYLRPGTDVIKEFNGLHDFINWPNNILTDSGGFQIFSLAELNNITEEGVKFQSHIDGSKLFLTPEKVMDIQNILNSDIAMVLDQCIGYPAKKEDVIQSMHRTHRWAERCKKVHFNDNQALFGIVQGGTFEDLRKISTEQIVELNFPGYAVGGLSVGEPNDLKKEVLHYSTPWLPENKPRYLMGVGTPEDILEGVEAGIDMFDCVLPTRNARNGSLFTSSGQISIKKKMYEKEKSPIDLDCQCYVCKNFSKSYLRHLYKSKELLFYTLASIHNLHFLYQLMEDIKINIKTDNYNNFKLNFLNKYKKK